LLSKAGKTGVAMIKILIFGGRAVYAHHITAGTPTFFDFFYSHSVTIENITEI
jgi:hypothetical protein